MKPDGGYWGMGHAEVALGLGPDGVCEVGMQEARERQS